MIWSEQPVAVLKDCWDYYSQIGWVPPPPPKGVSPKYVLAHECCYSCHEDRDMGYELIDVWEGNRIVGEVCCAVSRALKPGEK